MIEGKSYHDLPYHPNVLGRLVYPGDDCCTIYKKRDFGGPETQLCLDESLTVQSFEQSDYEFMDVTSAVWCGAHVRYEMWNGEAEATALKIITGAGNV